LFGLAFFNSAVHVIMYTYYLAAVVNHGWSQYWKKWVTRLQILQFVTGAFGGTIFCLLYVTKPSFSMSEGFNFVQGCAGKSHSIFGTFLVNISFLILFTRFFQKTYRRRRDEITKKKFQ
jgi:Ni,Fe-hydrogenase I cytochrome b subunit